MNDEPKQITYNGVPIVAGYYGPKIVVDANDYYRRPETIRRTCQRVGRNEPCPCGSGQKFKKCHGGHHG